MSGPLDPPSAPAGSRRTTLIVPVKGVRIGKQRLAGILADGERRALVEAMLVDVLTAALSCDQISRVAVVTDDDDAADLGSSHGAMVLRGGGSSDYSRCVRWAVDHLRGSDPGPLIVVPADVPLVRPRDLAAVAGAIARPGRVALVKAEPDGGTNCIGLSSSTLIDFRFGPGSFAAHADAIRRFGHTAVILDLPGLRFDVDRPDQLVELGRGPETAGAVRLVRGFDIATRLARAPDGRRSLSTMTDGLPDDR